MMTAQRIAAIPTKYKGVQFRSRLEARWAAMFDLIGYEWDYEPIDGVGYIPDFIINGHGEHLIVEVKPFFDISYDNIGLENLNWKEVFAKMKNAGLPNLPLVIVGSKVHRLSDIYKPHYEDANYFKDVAVLGLEGRHNWESLIEFTFDDYDCIKSKWLEAGNLVQYKGACR